MEGFTERVIQIIRGIPAGTVMTYGQIARLAGSPRAARQVVRVLHSMSRKHSLPWHRVINSRGEIGFRDGIQSTIQTEALENEGVYVTPNGRIDLDTYQYHP